MDVVALALVREYIAGASHRGLPPETLERLVEPRYASIDLPVLVAWGVEDTWILVERGRTLAATIPCARYVPIDGAGHLVQVDAPEALAEALVDFLGERGPGRVPGRPFARDGTTVGGATARDPERGRSSIVRCG